MFSLFRNLFKKADTKSEQHDEEEMDKNDNEYSSGEDVSCPDGTQGGVKFGDGQPSDTYRISETNPGQYKLHTKIKGKKSQARPSPMLSNRHSRHKKNRYDPAENDHQTTHSGYPGYTQGYGQGSGQGHELLNQGQGAGMGGFHPGIPGAEFGRQNQLQGQVLREAQASKQMVYEVYGNCITMLEELENRELQRSGQEVLPRSDIYLPDQSQYDDDTIRTKLDTQLLLLQCQITSCHDAIKDEVKDELKESTLTWSSAREEKKLPHGRTDAYAEKLFSLLEIGKTQHPKEFYEAPTIDETGMKNALGAIMQGQQSKSNLDKAFREDSNKKAKAPRLRRGAGIDQGADRIVQTNPELEHVVDNYRTSLL